MQTLLTAGLLFPVPGVPKIFIVGCDVQQQRRCRVSELTRGLTRHDALVVMACEGGQSVYTAELADYLRQINARWPGLLVLKKNAGKHPGGTNWARPMMEAHPTPEGIKQSCAALRRCINKPHLLARRYY